MMTSGNHYLLSVVFLLLTGVTSIPKYQLFSILAGKKKIPCFGGCYMWDWRGFQQRTLQRWYRCRTTDEPSLSSACPNLLVW